MNKAQEIIRRNKRKHVKDTVVAYVKNEISFFEAEYRLRIAWVPVDKIQKYLKSPVNH